MKGIRRVGWVCPRFEADEATRQKPQIRPAGQGRADSAVSLPTAE